MCFCWSCPKEKETFLFVDMHTKVYVCVRARAQSVVSDSATPWTVAHQAPLSMGFSRQEYWSGLPFPSPGDLPDPGIEPASLVSPALAGGFFTPAPPGMPQVYGTKVTAARLS